MAQVGRFGCGREQEEWRAEVRALGLGILNASDPEGVLEEMWGRQELLKSGPGG